MKEVAIAAMQYFIQTTGSPRNSAAPTPTTVCQYPARLRPSALGLEPGRSQIAYLRRLTASTGGPSVSGRVPLGAGVSKVKFDVSDYRFPNRADRLPRFSSEESVQDAPDTYFRSMTIASSAFVIRERDHGEAIRGWLEIHDQSS